MRMDVCFTIQAKCRVNNIDKTPTEDEIESYLDRILYKDCGISADVKITGLRYLESGESGKW